MLKEKVQVKERNNKGRKERERESGNEGNSDKEKGNR